MDLFDKHGGYRKLDSFTLTSIIQLGTWRFCETFLTLFETVFHRGKLCILRVSA